MAIPLIWGCMKQWTVNKKRFHDVALLSPRKKSKFYGHSHGRKRINVQRAKPFCFQSITRGVRPAHQSRHRLRPPLQQAMLQAGLWGENKPLACWRPVPSVVQPHAHRAV
eukprot:352088-Chlamydomonas_euryale.AAC.8